VSGPDAAPGLAEIAKDLEAEESELDSLVAGLPAVDWDLPTPAQGWAIRDQISHLAYFDDTGALALEDPEAFAPLAQAATEAMAAGIDPMSEHLARGRSMTPTELIEWWREAGRRLFEVLGVTDGSARVPWFGPPMSAKSFASARVMEVWAHGQDIVDALGVLRAPTARLRHVAHLGVRARGFSYAVRSMDLSSEPVYVALVAPDGTSWAWGEPDSSSAVTGPALDFCLVVTRRRHVSDVSLSVKGDAAVEWMEIAQAFAGPPGPDRQKTRNNS
jgi:uncharacterized protein (TIGR03084 family)